MCGLDNRKNRHFHDWLDHHAVKTFPGAFTLVTVLRQAEVTTAVFSASRNAAAVLRSAGVFDVFDAIVTGDEAEELDIPGKPDSAMLREAAARLGVSPAQAAVVEDATAGIEAAAAPLGQSQDGAATVARVVGANEEILRNEPVNDTRQRARMDVENRREVAR